MIAVFTHSHPPLRAMSLQPTASRVSRVSDHKDKDIEQLEIREELTHAPGIKPEQADLYAEALEKYGVDGDIDPEAEKRVRRKLDMRIIPVLGMS